MWPLKKRKVSELPPSEDPTSIGNLVVRHEMCTPLEMSRLLQEFQASTVEQLLGKFLVSKGILTEEQLELLLLKQAAERNGGVEHEHVMRALKLAESTGQKSEESTDRFIEATSRALAKVGG